MVGYDTSYGTGRQSDNGILLRCHDSTSAAMLAEEVPEISVGCSHDWDESSHPAAV